MDISTIPPRTQRRREHRAVAMLLISCLVWGMGFNWNKQGQALLGARLAEITGEASAVDWGPAWFLALRFLLATVCWGLVFPDSLRGWSRTTLRGGAWGGTCLAGGLLVQHYGLAYTSESLSAFLTSLTILFTPLMAVFVLGQKVSRWLWAAIACATAGVATMSLYREQAGFDRGAFFGLMCAVVFSVHMLVVDRYGRLEDRSRFSLAQFLVAGVWLTLFSLLGSAARGVCGVPDVLRAAATLPMLGFLLLTVGPGTLLTFGLMFRYQPDTTATRAALIYLSEPLFATAYAWLAAGSTITPAALVGAGLILLGNLAAEFLARRPDEDETPRAGNG